VPYIVTSYGEVSDQYHTMRDFVRDQGGFVDDGEKNLIAWAEYIETITECCDSTPDSAPTPTHQVYMAYVTSFLCDLPEGHPVIAALSDRN